MNQVSCKLLSVVFFFFGEYFFFLYIRNQITPQNTIIYLIVKLTVIISEPVQMEVILRKRIAVTMNKTEGWWPGKTLKNFINFVRNLLSYISSEFHFHLEII